VKNLIPLEILPQATEDFLEKLTNFDPQVSICGSKNVWIVKPGGKSRGRDIMVFSNLEDIKSYTQNSQQWVVQKYIENPLLIQNKKFDIRQWVLVSNSNPLTIWVYPLSYLRFSVENYDLSNLSNKYSHLTNNSISKNSKKFKSIGNGCMWHISQFIDYLRERRHKDYWRETIFPKIKDIITYSISSAGNLGRKNCIELFGYDFMIDNTLTPWLIEINSSPAMDYSTVISI
jgi:tubulin monoglycylase TTLL3/8